MYLQYDSIEVSSYLEKDTNKDFEKMSQEQKYFFFYLYLHYRILPKAHKSKEETCKIAAGKNMAFQNVSLVRKGKHLLSVDL